MIATTGRFALATQDGTVVAYFVHDHAASIVCCCAGQRVYEIYKGSDGTYHDLWARQIDPPPSAFVLITSVEGAQ